MDVYRKSPVPVIYTELGFVRVQPPCLLADCPDDVVLLRHLQKVAGGRACVSELESANQIILKIQFPDDIIGRNGVSWDAIQWHCYYWKVWDAESYVTGIRPAEAVPLTDAGIDDSFLRSVAHPTSCLPLLRTAEQAFDDGRRKSYTLRPEISAKLEQEERQLIARAKLTNLKQLKPPVGRTRSKPCARFPISSKLRKQVLRRDNHRCIFCGRDSSLVTVEVNHIIPRSLINKLDLEPRLHTAPENLCVTCFDCNRGVGDHLAKGDVAFYSENFSDASHANHGIVRYLAMIGRLQTQ